MSPASNPFNSVYLLISSNLNTDQSIPLILESIDNEILIQANDGSQLFHSTPSRLQFLFSTGKIPEDLFRKINLIKSDDLNRNTSEYYHSAVSALVQLVAVISDSAVPEDLQKFKFELPFSPESNFTNSVKTRSSRRISILKFDEVNYILDFVFDKGILELQKLSLPEEQDKNRKLIKQAFKYLKPPFDLYVHQLSKSDALWKAEAFIILPDFLVDVTSIASCYNHIGINPLKHLIHLFTYRPTALSTLVGTSINQFLDELILNPDTSFEEISRNIFQHNPIAFSLLSDTDVMKFHETIKLHYQNIREIVRGKFNMLIEHLENCLMEPSFYSVEYGIQGRLDVFYANKTTNHKLIIELKSGKPFLPNHFGINTDHHAQIMLYYLIIQSVYGSYQDVQSNILYSSQSENALRNAPVIESIKQDLIHLRNSIILVHLNLAFRNTQDPFILDLVTEKHYNQTEAFTKRDAGIILTIYSQLTPVEKEYFKELCGFIAREQFISKMGRSNMQYTEGLASLWLLSEHEKINNFMILQNLRISEIIQEKGEYPILILHKDSDDDFISNFRNGDTLVLYSGHSALKEQIYKCTLIEHFPNEFHIRLRTRQFPDPESSKLKKWKLEHDSLDRSFIYQFQGLLDFSQADTEVRQRIMGIIPPRLKEDIVFKELQNTPEIIRPTIRRILQSRDYFLLWGPPGSGKTSMVIKELTKLLYADTDESILLLAYTNRAVDEICEAIEQIEIQEKKLDYIRIGSRFSVAPKFRKSLLEEKINPLQNRKQLQHLLKRTRIFTATISSIQGKKELFYLKKFQTVIIDEASQILESQLTGLLPRFDRFILIGDHMQLPAVTSQTEEECKIQSASLQNLGFQSLNISLFERLLNQCKAQEWSHAFDMLKYQGRMHESLMKFPSKVFYDAKLQILPEREIKRQSQNYAENFKSRSNAIETFLATHRTIFIHCENPESIITTKTNPLEAKWVSTIIKNLFALYQSNNKSWNEFSLGVISPFRAQIAMIKKQLHLDALDSIPVTVDTAERYQGSTREIIILSTVISEENQLAQISSMNQNGIDRKLNVALTRAKEQIILIGNENVLNTSPLYRQLINDYWKWEERTEKKDFDNIEGE